MELVGVEPPVLRREQGIRDVEVLDIVDLVPLDAAHVERAQAGKGQMRQGLEDHFVILVIAVGANIGG